jgi:CRISPR-associated exonuclease Cas4
MFDEPSWLLLTGLGLLLASLLLVWGSRRLRLCTGLPVGRVVYSDMRTWRECPDALYAPSANLAGKPDYLVQRWNYVLPVEVKSTAAPSEPYPSHVLQLAAYCLLVEEHYGRRPPHGLIHYADRTFAVHYTPELEQELLNTIEWMREDIRDGRADRSHDDPARCHACSYAAYCDQQLAS